MTMGYKIQYNCVGRKLEPKKRSKAGIFAGLLVLLLVVAAVTVKSVGLQWVREVLLPGDPAVTAAALGGFVLDIKEGDTLVDAITAFCQEIVNGAK